VLARRGAAVAWATASPPEKAKALEHLVQFGGGCLDRTVLQHVAGVALAYLVAFWVHWVSFFCLAFLILFWNTGCLERRFRSYPRKLRDRSQDDRRSSLRGDLLLVTSHHNHMASQPVC
jgi:hypothetical protein